MAFKPCNDRRKDSPVQQSKLGEFYGEFFTSTRGQKSATSSSSGADGVMFGQKATLNSNSPYVSVDSPERSKTQWNIPASVSAFSDLTPDLRLNLSSLRLPHPSASDTNGSCDNNRSSCDGEVETDLARVHPNSSVNGHVHHGLFKLSNDNSTFHKPYLKSQSVMTPTNVCREPINPFLLNLTPPVNKLNNGHSMRSRPEVLSVISGKEAQSERLKSIPAFSLDSVSAFTLPSGHYTTSNRDYISTPHTPSPASPHTHPHHSHDSHTPVQQLGIAFCDLLDTEVKFTNRKTDHTSRGVVINYELHDKFVTVRKHSGTIVKVPCSDIKLVTPRSNDKVKVVYSNGGNKILGKTGTLLSVTGDSGVVQFTSHNGNVGRNLAQVKLSHLARYINSQSSTTATPVSCGAPSQPAASSVKPVWGTAMLKCGTTFQFAPTIPGMAFQTLVPVMGSTAGSVSLYNPVVLSNPATSPNLSGCDGANSPIYEPPRQSTHGPAHCQIPRTGMPLSFQIPPSSTSKGLYPEQLLLGKQSTSTNKSLSSTQLLLGTSSKSSYPKQILFGKPISRGGSSSKAVTGSSRRHSTGGDVAEIIERLLSNQRTYHMKKEDDSNTDVKASCIRVSLVCPISQKRLKYPSRGDHCKHLQCFDAEAYILMNLHHRPKARVKQANGRSFVQPLLNKKWHCPICLKQVQETQLYIDKSLMHVVSELTDSVMEVELSESGNWKPYKKVAVDIIDLTEDDD